MANMDRLSICSSCVLPWFNLRLFVCLFVLFCFVLFLLRGGGGGGGGGEAESFPLRASYHQRSVS